MLHQSFDCNVAGCTPEWNQSEIPARENPERKQEARFLRLTDYWDCSLMHFLFVITFIEGFNNDDVWMSVCSGKMCEERKQRNSHATELWKIYIFSRPSLSSLAFIFFSFWFCIILLSLGWFSFSLRVWSFYFVQTVACQTIIVIIVNVNIEAFC